MPFGTLHKIFTLGCRLKPMKPMFLQRSIHISGVRLTDEEVQKSGEEFGYKSEEPRLFPAPHVFVNQVTIMGKLIRPPKPLVNNEGQLYGYVFHCMSKYFNKSESCEQSVAHDLLCLRRQMFGFIEPLKGNETMIFTGRMVPRGRSRPDQSHNTILTNLFFKIDDSYVDNDDDVIEF